MAPALPVWLRRFQRSAAWIAVLVGALTLLGWGLGSETLIHVAPGLPAMPPLSAALFFLGGLSLATEGVAARRLAIPVLTGGVAAAAVHALATTVPGAHPALSTAPALLPSVPATLTTILGATALFLRTAHTPRLVWLSQWCALLACLNVLRALLGFFPMVRATLPFDAADTASLHGTLTAMLLGLGVLASRPDDGFMALVASPLPAGRLMRRLVVIGAALPLLVMLATAVAWERRVFGPVVGFVGLLLANLVLSFHVVNVYARSDAARRSAEGRLAQLNADLERRIARRTADLEEREAALERDRRFQAALFACSQALLTAADSEQARGAALDTVIGQLAAAIGADRVFLMHQIEDAALGPCLRLDAEAVGPGWTRSLDTGSPPLVPLGLLTGELRRYLTLGEPSLIDLAAVAEVPQLRAALARYDVRTMICFPLWAGGMLWGGIAVQACGAPQVWDEQETLLIRTMADLICGAIRQWEYKDHLRSREKLLTTLFDILPVGVALVGEDRHFLRLNRAMAQLLGYGGAEIDGGRYHGLHYITADGRPLPPDQLPSARALRGELVRDVEVGIVSPGGELRWASASAAPLPLDGIAAALVAVDVTERRQLESERLAFERKLLEAQRLESLGVLAGGAAHDFNNILTTIQGHAELARLDLAPGSEAAASLDAIVLGARRAADLTAQMLAYAGRGRFVTETVQLNAVVHELCALTRATLPTGVLVRYKLAPEPPPIIADPTQVRQVLLNLLTNAAEAIIGAGATGEITIATGLVELAAADLDRASVSGAAPGAYCFLEVADNGPGIGIAALGRIFEPFFSTKFTGRGLGLAAVQGIMRAHSGALFVASEPGRGACFRACFPPAQEDGAREARRGQRVRLRPGDGRPL